MQTQAIETAKHKAKNYMMYSGADEGLGKIVKICLMDNEGKRSSNWREAMCAGLVGNRYVFVEQVIENLNGTYSLVGFAEWDEPSMYSEWLGGYKFEICPRDKPDVITKGNPKERTQLSKNDLEHILKLWGQRKIKQ